MPKAETINHDPEEVRSWFPHTDYGHIYLNHAAISPISTRVEKAILEFIEERQSGPIDNLEHCMQIIEETRMLAAGYLNAEDPSAITFVGNTSDGISAIAEGLDLDSGDEIILNAMEFPTNVQPYRALAPKGVKTVVIETPQREITAEMIEKHITPKTKLVSLSAVQFLSGYRADLEAIGKLCHEKNILFIVDAIQCLGAFQIDVQKCRIDALASGGHKWLMSPMGLGFLYTSPALAGKLKPYKTGWLSVEKPWDLFRYEQEWLPFSGHLETGTPNMIGITGLGASLKMFNELGHDFVSERILNLTGHLISRLSESGKVSLFSPGNDLHRAGIVSFSIDGPKDLEPVINRLKEEKITISAREGLLRIAPHFYNTTAEIDKVLEKLPI
jgi:cysteine desulfurase / selenocysteine lyase